MLKTKNTLVLIDSPPITRTYSYDDGETAVTRQVSAPKMDGDYWVTPQGQKAAISENVAKGTSAGRYREMTFTRADGTSWRFYSQLVGSRYQVFADGTRVSSYDSETQPYLSAAYDGVRHDDTHGVWYLGLPLLFIFGDLSTSSPYYMGNTSDTIQIDDGPLEQAEKLYYVTETIS